MWGFLEHEQSYGDAKLISIGLMLEPEQQTAAVKFSKHVCKDIACSFVLDHELHPPIVRLYETVLPLEEIDTARSRVNILANNMIPFEMKWGEMERTQHFTAIWGETNDTLELFHSAVIEQINPLRHGFYKLKYADPRRELTLEEQRSLNTWGSPWAEPYIPHIILAKYHVNSYVPDENETWDFSRVKFGGLFFGVRNGNTFDSMATFPFQRVTL